MPQTILIVDDDPTQRRLLETVIGREGYRIRSVAGGVEALKVLDDEKGGPVDLILLDLVMPDLDGMSVLGRIKPKRPDLPVIVLTAQSGVDIIVKAMRAGASDFIVKPASPERLQVSIANALKLNQLAGQVGRLTRRIAGQMTFGDLIAVSAPMQRVVELARKAAASQIPILIEGESGVGKEMVARSIQGSGDRAGQPFVAVNCGAIPENLVESILFGHEKGAFTGASSKHVGKFQEASGGTLFLDEIGELKPDIQVKLLRALQEGEVDPVGGNRPVKVDIRLISATNRTLQQLVDEGKFREDLYYRLNVYPVFVPPLRERRADIQPLLDHFVAAFAASEGKQVQGVSPEALAVLLDYSWPGNVRQLENAVFRAVVLSDGELLTVGDFPQIAQQLGLPGGARDPASLGRPGNGRPADGLSVLDANGDVRPLESVENDLIRMAIQKYDGQMSEVARRLGIGRSTLYRKVKDLGLDI